MPEHQMESAYAVKPAHAAESAIHDEVYSPSSQWATFEKLNSQGKEERNSNYLDMSASDPYKAANSKAEAPSIGDPARLDFRQDRQEHAIFDGVKAGEIDFDEYVGLQQEQSLIDRAQQYFGADGFSEQELRNLDMLQNSARQHIIDAGGCDELKYGNEEKPEEHGAEEEHGGEEEHGSEEEHGGEKEHGAEEKGEEHPEEEHAGEEEHPPESPQDPFKDFMSFLDQNGDGQITLEELLQAFQAMDADGDGVVSPEEFKKFMDKLASQKPEEGAEEPGGEEVPAGEEPSSGEEPPGEEPSGEESPEEPQDVEATPGEEQLPEGEQSKETCCSTKL